MANSNNETNFPHQLLLTKRQASAKTRPCKTIANDSSANMKL